MLPRLGGWGGGGGGRAGGAWGGAGSGTWAGGGRFCVPVERPGRVCGAPSAGPVPAAHRCSGGAARRAAAVRGAAEYLFSTSGTLLTTFTNPTPGPGDRFGVSVAAVGSDRVLIGAYEDDTGVPSAGVAYLFSIERYTPGLVADAVNARSITTASLEDGAVTAAKIGGVLFPSQIPELDLDASKIISGTLSDARLSANVAL